MKTIKAARGIHCLTRFCLFLTTVALVVGMVGCDGCTPSQNLEIRDWHDLDAVRNNLDGSYILMNDLDSTTAGYEELASPTANEGKGWEPIGFLNPWNGMDGFRGTFDGQGHEIRNLFINHSPFGFDVGLFGVVDPEGIVQNIGVVNADVTGFSSVGGLVGANGGTVSNSYSTGNVAGDGHVGGLAGVNGGTVSNSYYNYDEVLINGQHIITIGALFDKDFEEWLANDKFLDVNDRLSQENGYYVVNNVTDFKELLAFSQDGSLKFRLKNDLDLSDEPNFCIPYLVGEFDGNGHKISNLSFNFDFVSLVGLFGCLASGGKVTDLGVEDVNITGDSLVGGLMGSNAGTVSYCHSTGNVTGDADVGGLMGSNVGTVSDSYSTGNVIGTELVGGLLGFSRGNVINSYFTGSVTGSGGWVGGLVGYSEGTVSDSYSTGNSTGEDGIGGLVGRNFGAVSDSYSTSSVTGYHSVGGLVGVSEGTVSNSYSTGSVNGTEWVGGLVAENDGTVSNSFWDTETSGQASSDGGTGKTTAQMRETATFSEADWNIVAVADSDTRNTAYIWNIVDGQTYPFLSWQA
jgi:hypothetical protein